MSPPSTKMELELSKQGITNHESTNNFVRREGQNVVDTTYANTTYDYYDTYELARHKQNTPTP